MLPFSFRIFVFAGSLYCAFAANDHTLELLQVFIRHGNRTASSTFDEYVPWFIETFHPFQFGQLLPQGRQQVFNTGSFIRQYYNDYLPEDFSYTDVAVTCTETNRVQESSAVAMAAMFPPKKKQKWQESGLGSEYTPIACSYVPSSQDILLEPDSTNCTRYNELSYGWLYSPEYLAGYNQLTSNGSVNEYVRLSLNMSEPFDQFDLYIVWGNLDTMNTCGLKLPSWSTAVYPEPLSSMVNLLFGHVYRSPELIRFSAGEFIKEILGIAALLEIEKLYPKSRKMYAYIGHDNTISAMLVALGFETLPPMVPYGAAFIMELHRNQTTSEIGYKEEGTLLSCFPRDGTVCRRNSDMALHLRTYLVVLYLDQRRDVTVCVGGSLNCAVAANDHTLELLQVFTRHGNRTALATIDEYQTWYMDTFSPFQYGQLTPQGRKQMINVGSYMRSRYNYFLPKEFSYAAISVQCSATKRVQESAAVTMTAIFPPKDRQIWQDSGLGTEYTPITCQYLPDDEDIVLDPFSVDCPRYDYLINQFLNSTYFLNKYNQLTSNGAVNEYIQTSLNLSRPVDITAVNAVWQNLEAMEDYKLPLPSWSTAVYPHPTNDIAAYGYKANYFDAESIRFSVGEFLKEILEVATLLESGQLTPKSRKMYAYFGHDKTIYSLLVALGFATFPPFCAYGSSIIMELYRNKITSEIGYKFLYRNGTEEPILYTVPGCQEICSLFDVKKQVEQYLPRKPYYEYCINE